LSVILFPVTATLYVFDVPNLGARGAPFKKFADLFGQRHLRAETYVCNGRRKYLCQLSDMSVFQSGKKPNQEKVNVTSNWHHYVTRKSLVTLQRRPKWERSLCCYAQHHDMNSYVGEGKMTTRTSTQYKPRDYFYTPAALPPPVISCRCPNPVPSSS
jgi:hypothetical protein